MASRGLGVHLWVSSTCNTAKYCFLCASRAFPNFCQFLAEKGEFSPKIDKILHQMTSFCWNFAPKKAQVFWIPHPMTPFFLQNPTPDAPYFHSPVGTYPSLSYSSTPGLAVFFKMSSILFRLPSLVESPRGVSQIWIGRGVIFPKKGTHI